MEIQNYSAHDDELQVTYSNFGVRLGAQILDGVFVTIIFVVIFAGLLSYMFTESDPSHESSTWWSLSVILYYFFGLPTVALFYRVFFESSKYQATPGKMICGLIVVDEYFERVSFLRAIGRNFMKIFSSFLLIGYLIALGDKKCRTLHDQVANTLVIMR